MPGVGELQRSGTNEPQSVDPHWLGSWLEAIKKEQEAQTRQLRNISTAASIFTLLVVLSFIGALLTQCANL